MPDSVPLSTVNDMVLPSLDHESGICVVPCSDCVSRSADPEPSAFCQKIPASPSRVEVKATYSPFADQIGYRFVPPTVSGRIAVAPERSYIHTVASLPSSVSNATRLPSGEILG